jgi:hypothetical protein
MERPIAAFTAGRSKQELSRHSRHVLDLARHDKAAASGWDAGGGWGTLPATTGPWGCSPENRLTWTLLSPSWTSCDPWALVIGSVLPLRSIVGETLSACPPQFGCCAMLRWSRTPGRKGVPARGSWLRFLVTGCGARRSWTPRAGHHREPSAHTAGRGAGGRSPVGASVLYRKNAHRAPATRPRSKRPVQWRVGDRLSEVDVQRLIAAFAAGTSKWRLAERYCISESSVKRLIRQHGASKLSCGLSCLVAVLPPEEASVVTCRLRSWLRDR